MAVCSKCGQEVSETSVVCQNCGNVLKNPFDEVNKKFVQTRPSVLNNEPQVSQPVQTVEPQPEIQPTPVEQPVQVQQSTPVEQTATAVSVESGVNPAVNMAFLDYS